MTERAVSESKRTGTRQVLPCARPACEPHAVPLSDQPIREIPKPPCFDPRYTNSHAASCCPSHSWLLEPPRAHSRKPDNFPQTRASWRRLFYLRWLRKRLLPNFEYADQPRMRLPQRVAPIPCALLSKALRHPENRVEDRLRNVPVVPPRASLLPGLRR